MTLNLKYFLLMIALALPSTQTVLAQEEAPEDEQAGAEEEPAVTDYVTMKPPFVTHVGGPDTSLKYLKAAVTLRASKKTTRPVLETHMPRLRHELVMLFGEQTDIDAIGSHEGQEALRQEAKKRINQALEEQQTGEQVTDVLFTEFVIQR